MALFSLLPLFLWPALRDWTFIQSIVAAVFASLVLIKLGFQGVRIKTIHLPWIAWPLLQFALASASLESFSEESIRLLVQFVLAVIVLSEDQNLRSSVRIASVVSVLLLAVQAYGVAFGNPHIALKSVFGQENAYQFVNLMALFLFIYEFAFEKTSPVWRVVAIFGLLLDLVSIIGGDTFATKVWALSAGDCLAVQVAAVLFGMLFILMLAIRRIKRLAWSIPWIFTIVALAFASSPLWMSSLGLWDSSFPSSITSRLTLWSATREMINAHLWTGVGVGAFGANIQDYWPSVNVALYKAQIFYIAAHHHLLHVFAEGGLVSYVLGLFIWIFPMWRCASQFRLSGDVKFLFGACALLSAQFATSILEVSQMFAVPQFGYWILLLCVVRLCNLSPLSLKIAHIRRGYLLLLLPVLVYVGIDRYQLLRSYAMTTSIEQTGVFRVSTDAGIVNEALQTHGKNLVALYYSAESHRLTGNNEKALEIIDFLQLYSGSRFPLHRMRAEVFRQQGLSAQACEEARMQLRFSYSPRDLILAKWQNECH